MIGKLVAALVEQFPFIGGSVAADVGSAIDLGLTRAHGADKDVDSRLAASIARGILTRCRAGRVQPADIVTVILRKVAAGAGHIDCLELRVCTCGDSLSVEIPCAEESSTRSDNARKVADEEESDDQRTTGALRG